MEKKTHFNRIQIRPSDDEDGSSWVVDILVYRPETSQEDGTLHNPVRLDITWTQATQVQGQAFLYQC